MDIRESFRKFVKDDQFERAAAVADVTGLGLQQKAEREGHILKVNPAGGCLSPAHQNILPTP